MKPRIAISFQTGNGDENYSIRKRYIDFLVDGGLNPVMLVPTGDFNDTIEIFERERVDGILLPGGDTDISPKMQGCVATSKTRKVDEELDKFDKQLAQYAYENDIPTLGICRGCQIMAVALGGYLEQHINGHEQDGNGIFERSVETNVELFGLLKDIYKNDSVLVKCCHHQSIRHMPGKKLEIGAKAKDGTIEAVFASDKKFFVGVQFHPEIMSDKKLINTFRESFNNGKDKE